ncbi:AAA family ATPase [Nocardia sp. NPDC047038]|uniref:helix-turn-helix transcriptional regulator n=1 Tax=Nocardia sp. NPDC047038 TaxID=3154338 RepID=UPI0033C1F636
MVVIGAAGIGHKMLVGRTSELKLLGRALADASAGSAAAVVVLGEPGIGKTRLLAEFCERAAADGFEVLGGRGTELESEVPFGVIVDALNERFASLVSEMIADVGQDRVAELAAVLPCLRGYGRQLGARLEVERFEFYRAVCGTFDRLVLRRPLVLALDDVHWADPASVELISFMLRRLVPGMILALAYRPGQTPGQLLDALTHVAADGQLCELKLSPLSIGEAAEALELPPDSSVVQKLHADSGGNPFYLEQLARMVTAGPPSGLSADVDVANKDVRIPITLRTTISQELTRLAGATLWVVRAGAVAGDPFDVDLVTAIAEADEAQVLKSLDELVRVDLVRPAATPGQFRFRHPIVRRVVYDDDSTAGWRIAAHNRAARALARRGGSVEERAHHVEYSAHPGDEEAAATLAEAAHIVAPHAPAAAVRWLQAALRLLPATRGGQQRLLLQVLLARALANIGNLRESRAKLEEVLEILPTGSVSDRVPIIRMIAHADHALGHAEETRHLIDATLDRVPADSADAIALKLELAQNQWMRGHWEQAVSTANWADVQATGIADSTLMVEAKSALAMFANDQGDFARAKELVDWVAHYVDASATIEIPEQLEGLSNLVFAEIYLGLLPAALRHAERGLKASRATGQNHVFGLILFSAAIAKMLLGRLSEARRDAEAAVEVALLLDNDPLRIWAESVRCWVETMSGNLPTALTAGRAAVRNPHPYYGWFAHACYGQALIEAGRYEQGRQELLSIVRPGPSGIPPGVSAIFLSPLVIAELAVGRIEAADALTRRLEDDAQDLPLSSGAWHLRAGHARYARACVYAARGDFQAAAAYSDKARESFDAVDARLWAARARLDAGRALARIHDAPAAIRELELAHTALRDIGATRLADNANKELRTLGKRIKRWPTTGQPADTLALTAREREVADRVVQGYTNREIAKELFISPKTVEKHLARVFAKLDTNSRSGIAAAMIRQQHGRT